jgi:O-acetyl-ADP-ribose deacetylase (regulator of RNase III)
MEKNRIEILQGDIAQLKVEAIVNAANPELTAGSGVSGAIHRAAGPELAQACQQLGDCPEGNARLTPGFQLPANYIIHAVGPIWRGGVKQEAYHLKQCYLQCLHIAHTFKVKSVAFPAISCGSYGFPIEKATDIAIRTILAYCMHYATPEKVYLVCFTQAMYETYTTQYQKIRTEYVQKYQLSD